MEEKKNYIREKCIAANAAIVELKFGCEVGFEDHRRIVYENKKGVLFFCDRGSMANLKAERLYEILGRPLQLSDILLAIDKFIPAGMWDKDYNVEDDDHEESSYVERVVEKWNLFKPFDEQPEKTIDFIYNLLQ